MPELASAALVALLTFITYCLAVWLKRPSRREYR